jgi:hypothetical protein
MFLDRYKNGINMAITLDGTTGIVAQAIDVVTPITVSDGGTGLTAVGTSGNILTSNGTSWVSSVPAISSVNTRTGAVTLTSSDVGLGNVSNTAQVTSVTGTSPVVSSGGTTPVISITAATTMVAGSMSATDKTKLDSLRSMIFSSFNMTITSVTYNSVVNLSITVSGAAIGDIVIITPRTSFGNNATSYYYAGLSMACWVSSANIITLSLRNGNPTYPASLTAETWAILVIKQ